MERLGIAGPQAGRAAQGLHRARPILERLVAGRQIQARLGRARIVRRHGEKLHQPVRRRARVAVLAGAARQLKQRLAVFRLNLQDLLEVRERRLTVATFCTRCWPRSNSSATRAAGVSGAAASRCDSSASNSIARPGASRSARSSWYARM